MIVNPLESDVAVSGMENALFGITEVWLLDPFSTTMYASKPAGSSTENHLAFVRYLKIRFPVVDSRLLVWLRVKRIWRGGRRAGVPCHPKATGLFLLPSTLPPTNLAPVGGYLEDQFPIGGTPCEVPC